MTKLEFKFLLFALMTIGLFGNSYAASFKEVYELQERCGKRAQELFAQKYGSGVSKTSDGQQEIVYTNHYNKKLNKCFVMTTHSNYVYKDNQPEYAKSFEKSLRDVNENKEYAKYVNSFPPQKVVKCEVADIQCITLEGWEALTKSYMSE
jgi:hypothetical protein